jgi:hypothetical protein
MRFDAYASQKTTLQATMRGTIETTFDRTSKYVHNVDSAFSFVLRDQPLRNADGASSAFLPTGFESTMVSTDGTYIRDLEGPNSLFGRLRYQHVASRFTLDFVTYPPTNRGPQATNVGEAQVGLIHALSSAWVSTSALGIGGAYLVPGSEERGVALSPVASEVIGYSSTNAGAQIGGRYSLASINPRLGVGTNLEVFGSLVGVPFPKAAPTLAFVANANGLRSVLSNNDDADTRIWVGAAGFELRYGFAEYLAAVVGYNVRATMVTGPDSVPDFVRNTVFAGLAASWSSTRNAATPSGLITPMVGY